MTRIGLISDTHIPVDAKVLPGQIKEIFHDVDLILHAGDIYLVSVLDELEHIAPVLAAQGDDDDHDIANDRRVKEKQVLTIEGVNISLTHGEPAFGRWSVFPNAKENLEDESYYYNNVTDILLFGHSHMPKVEKRGQFLLVNPGSPTFPYYIHRPGTVVLLTVSPGEAEVRLVQLR